MSLRETDSERLISRRTGWTCECGKRVEGIDYKFCPFCSKDKDIVSPPSYEVQQQHRSSPTKINSQNDSRSARDVLMDSDISIQVNTVGGVGTVSVVSAGRRIPGTSSSGSKGGGSTQRALNVRDGNSATWKQFSDITRKKRLSNYKFTSILTGVIMPIAYACIPFIDIGKKKSENGISTTLIVFTIIFGILLFARIVWNIYILFFSKVKKSPSYREVNYRLEPKIEFVMFAILVMSPIVTRFSSTIGGQVFWVAVQFFVFLYCCHFFTNKCPFSDSVSFCSQTNSLTLHYTVGVWRPKKRSIVWSTSDITGLHQRQLSKNPPENSRGDEHILAIDGPRNWRIVGNYNDLLSGLKTLNGFDVGVDPHNIPTNTEKCYTKEIGIVDVLRNI